jgi:hypothetical protein
LPPRNRLVPHPHPLDRQRPTRRVRNPLLQKKTKSAQKQQLCCFATFTIALTRLLSCSFTSDIARPERPARAVRPTRCTYSLCLQNNQVTTTYQNQIVVFFLSLYSLRHVHVKHGIDCRVQTARRHVSGDQNSAMKSVISSQYTCIFAPCLALSESCHCVCSCRLVHSSLQLAARMARHLQQHTQAMSRLLAPNKNNCLLGVKRTSKQVQRHGVQTILLI